MKIQFDHNHLLTIENDNIPQTKEYTYSAGGYTFSDFDKGLLVLHKKDFKITNLKNFSDNMNVVYYKENRLNAVVFQQAIFEDALRLFKWFDEETGEKYYFIPGLGEKDIQEKNTILQSFSACEIKKTTKGAMVEFQHANEDILNRQKNQWNEVFLDDWVIPTTWETVSTNEMQWLQISKEIRYKTNEKPQIQDILSYVFGLILLYGKFDAKKGELASIKIQIPLFGQYLAQQDMIDKIIKDLQQDSIFLKADKLTNNNGITYQISSNDYELLEICAKWYEPVEKFEKISKREFADEMKSKLMSFIETNPEIPSDGKEDVLEQIKNGVIKFLMK